MVRMNTMCAVLAVCGLCGAAGGEIVEFSFPIDVDQEVPTPTIPGPSPVPFGTGVVQLDTGTNMISWTIDYQDLTGPIVTPGAHLHGPADYGATAGVQLFLSDGDPPEPSTGTLVGSASITDTQEADLLAGLWYVNIHTSLNQPGEIRGQVVPEPTSAGFLVFGTVALMLRPKRRH